MADFQRRRLKPSKDNGSYIFSDFSHGLYLLDTPRGLGEQLTSLALTGGRNIWSENGALVPQYGYMEKGHIANEYIIATSKDTGNSAFYLLTNLGNVYYYTVAQGLKLYKTTLEEVSENALITTRNNELLVIDNDQKKNTLFGDFYSDSSSVTINEAVQVLNYGSYVELKIPKEDEKYYWLGKKIGISGAGVSNITYMSKTGTGMGLGDIRWEDLESPSRTRQIRKSVLTDEIQEGSPKVYNLGTNTSVTFTNTKGSGTSHTITKSDLQWVCYKIEYPKNFLYNGFLFATSISKNLPTYVWMKKGTKAGWVTIKTITSGKSVTTATESDLIDVQTTCTSRAVDGKVYKNEHTNNPFKVYQVSDGYVTSLSNNPKMTGTVVGKDAAPLFNNMLGITNTSNPSPITSLKVSRYKSGDIYKTTTVTEVIPASKTITKVSFNIPLDNGSTISHTTGEIETGLMEFRLTYFRGSNKTQGAIYKGSDLIAATPLTDGKPSSIVNEPLSLIGIEPKANIELYEYIGGEYQIMNEEPYDAIVIRAIPEKGIDNIPNHADIYEKADHQIELVYKPEASGSSNITLIPKLANWVNNRLFIVNNDGKIYYSQVGLVDGFQQKYGSGYFGGFYNDTSEVLSIEEFLTYTLITKKNGMYALKLADTISSTSVSFDSSVGLEIEKISEIGQEYASDHVIVRDKIYAYDSNSASIVNAIQHTVFGTLTSGQTLVSAEYLDAVKLGISDTKRFLTFNGEANTMILYYGEDYKQGLVLTLAGSLFPRELDRPFRTFIGLNQSVCSVSEDGRICQDFKKNTVILNKTPIAEFEAIGLKDNRQICASIVEVTELNGVQYDITTLNGITSYQKVHPYINYGVDKTELPPFVYSDSYNGVISDSFELTTKWAEKKANLTRVYAPMSGRSGVSISLEFAPNQDFCLAALRLPDFSQGE